MGFKKLPIGVEDFIEANNYFYIDKTLIIRDILNYHIGHSLLITRPRRFGKSLTVSMIESFFSNKLDCLSEFEDKKILEDESFSSYLNKYPVIHLSMKNISHNNKDLMLRSATEQISSIFGEFKEAIDDVDLLAFEKTNYLKIANHEFKNDLEYADSIFFLSKILYKKYRRKVIILIDEYDTPLENAYQNGFYDSVVDFFKRLYSSALKGNEYLLFSLTTGVLQISKESIFSELNNLNVFSVVDDGFMEYFGFTEEEVKFILNKFDISVDYQKVQEWYGGYGGKKEIFNPWSILNYVQNEVFDYYWVNSGSNETISNLIRNTPNSITVLNQFINNENLDVTIDTSISYKDVRYDIGVLFSLLVQGGYLVAKRIGMEKRYNVFIPNKEIKEVFSKEIISRNNYYSNYQLVNALRNAILKGEVDNIPYLLNELILSSFSYYDLTKEKDYQILIVTLLDLLFDEYIVKSEVNNSRGRCDIMLLPKNKIHPGMIIELKKYKGSIGKARLQSYADEAIKQIKDLQYYQEIKRNGVPHSLLYAFIFDDRQQEIKVEEISLK